jgi:pectinesterase
VFRRAKITAADLGGKVFYLGRPWRPYARVVFLDSWMPESLSPEGWSPWKKDGSIEDVFYAERGSVGPGARVQTFLHGSHELTAAEARPFTPDKFLAGTDRWNAIAEASKLP